MITAYKCLVHNSTVSQLRASERRHLDKDLQVQGDLSAFVLAYCS